MSGKFLNMSTASEPKTQSTNSSDSDEKCEDEVKRLRELEIERRRIISSQIVRRKKKLSSSSWICSKPEVEPGAEADGVVQLGHRHIDQDSVKRNEDNDFATINASRGHHNKEQPPASVDTSSIIENKETLKEYWERRMMAEQSLVVTTENGLKYEVSNAKILLSKPSSLSSVSASAKELSSSSNNISSSSNNRDNCAFKRSNGKLGSDGESETSPESSLSPIDGDSSFEEIVSSEESTSRQSPGADSSSSASSSSSEGERDEQLTVQASQSNESHEPPIRFLSCAEITIVGQVEICTEDPGQVLEKVATTADTLVVSEEGTKSTDPSLVSQEAVQEGNELQAGEENLLSTVIEEEPDSLEEFIKHESECMGEHNPGEAKCTIRAPGQPPVARAPPPVVVAAARSQTDGSVVEACSAEEKAAKEVQIESEDLIEPEATASAAVQESLEGKSAASKTSLPEEPATFVVNTFENSPFAPLQADVVTQLSFEEIETPSEIKDADLNGISSESADSTLQSDHEKPSTGSTGSGATETVLGAEQVSGAQQKGLDIVINASEPVRSNLAISNSNSSGSRSTPAAAQEEKVVQSREVSAPTAYVTPVKPREPFRIVAGKTRTEAERKIALEIQESKKREEELRQMREETAAALRQQPPLAIPPPPPPPPPPMPPALVVRVDDAKTVCSDISSISLDITEGGRFSPSNSEISTTDSHYGGRAASVESFESSTPNCYSPTSSSIAKQASRLNRINVKVKPFGEREPTNEEITSPAAYQALIESPIEREIRISRERDDELHVKAKAAAALAVGKLVPAIVNATSAGNSSTVETTTSSSKLPPLRETVSSGQNATTSTTVAGVNGVVGGGGSIQKILATTRIQQEIEEQTQREIALRASGSIKTISQERSDSKVTKLGEFEKVTSASTLTSPTMTTTLTATGAFVDKKEECASSDTSCSVTSEVSVDEVKQEKKLFVKNHSASNGKQPLSNSSKLASPVVSSIARKPCISPLFGFGSTKSISMQKFISSKGTLTTSSKPNYSMFGSQGNLSPANDYQELRPPQLFRGDFKGPVRRGSLSAENKIQEELKDMREREEELRNQRTRFLALSQSNLTLIGDATDIDGSSNINQTDVDSGLKRTSSNPTLSSSVSVTSSSSGRSSNHEEAGDSDIKEIYTRKRNSLIARWEQRIQQEENKQRTE